MEKHSYFFSLLWPALIRSCECERERETEGTGTRRMGRGDCIEIVRESENGKENA